MKRLVAFLALLGLALASPLFAADAVKIGVMAPVTGQWASEGQDMVNIVKLLADDINKNGGVNGHAVEIEVGDDGGDPKVAALAAQRLIDSGVVAVVGTYGSAITEAAQDIYAEDGVLQIGTGSTSVRLTEKGLPLFFRTCPRDDDQGKVMVKNVASFLGFKKAAILHDNSSYAKGLADEAHALLKEAGVKEVFFDALTPGERDYTTILTKMKTTDPDVIIFTGYYPEAAMLLRQKKEMGWDVAMIGGDATNNSDLIELAGAEAAAGYYFISPPGPSDLRASISFTFLSEFKSRHGTLPTSIWSLMAGDAFKVLMEAAKHVDKIDAESLAGYLHNDLKDYKGFTGTISFNEKGDRVGDLYRLYQVSPEGKFVLVENK